MHNTLRVPVCTVVVVVALLAAITLVVFRPNGGWVRASADIYNWSVTCDPTFGGDYNGHMCQFWNDLRA